jgi:hypothetical protein
MRVGLSLVAVAATAALVLVVTGTGGAAHARVVGGPGKDKSRGVERVS